MTSFTKIFLLFPLIFCWMKIRPFSRKKSPKFAHLSCFSDSFTQPLTVEWWMPNFLAVSLNVWSTAYLRTSSLNLVEYFAKSYLYLLFAWVMQKLINTDLVCLDLEHHRFINNLIVFQTPCDQASHFWFVQVEAVHLFRLSSPRFLCRAITVSCCLPLPPGEHASCWIWGHISNIWEGIRYLRKHVKYLREHIQYLRGILDIWGCPTVY